MADPEAVLLDSDVFSVLFVPRRSDQRAHRWEALVAGRQVVVSFMTRGQVLAGSFTWGARRRGQLRELVGNTAVVPADDDVVDAYAGLAGWARASGHGIHQPIHGEDRWIAACAIAKGLPLLTGDRVFIGLPDLTLLDEPRGEHV